MENTVPIIIALKNTLELRRSPVIKDLMAYLQVPLTTRPVARQR